MSVPDLPPANEDVGVPFDLDGSVLAWDEEPPWGDRRGGRTGEAACLPSIDGRQVGSGPCLFWFAASRSLSSACNIEI